MAKFRFRLSSLLILITLIAIATGIFGIRYHRNLLRLRALDFIKNKGGQIVQDKTNSHAQRVYLDGKKFDDKLVAELTQQMKFLPKLEEVDLVRVEVTDQGVEVLAGLKQIKVVYIFETAITETGIRNLEKLMPHVSIKTEQPDPAATKLASTTIYRHAIVALTGSPRDGRIATGSGDGAIRIWEIDSSEPIEQWLAHADWVFDLEYSPDGRQIASGGGDNVVRVWDAETYELVSELVGHLDDVHDVGFSPEGNLLVSAGDDMTIRLWDPATGKSIRVLEGHTGQIPRLAINREGTLLASASRDHTVRLWELPSGEPLGVFSGHHCDVMTVVFDPTDRLLASADEEGQIHIWNASSFERINTIESNIGGVYDLAFDARLETFAACGAEGIQLWDALTGQTRTSFDQQYLSRISFDAADGFLVSAGAAGELCLLNQRTAAIERKFQTMHGARGLEFE